MLLVLAAIIIFIKIKSRFHHKLLSSAWKRGRFQYLPAEEEGFASVGTSLVQPWWEPHGLHSFPFHLHSGVSCSELPAAFHGLGQSWGKPSSVCPEPLISLWLCGRRGSVQAVLCATSCLQGHSFREEAELGRALAEPRAAWHGDAGAVPAVLGLCPIAVPAVLQALPACSPCSALSSALLPSLLCPQLTQPHPNASARTSQMHGLGSGMQSSCSRCKSTIWWVGMSVWLCAGVAYAKPYFPFCPE